MSRPFQTRVLSAWDYRQGDLSEFCLPFEADREALAESLLAVRKKYALRVPVDRVEEGNIVTLRCRSEKAKFQRESVKINVGKGLYSKELESQLPGLAVGDERELTVGGAAVAVRVLQVERTVLPELTDEFVSEHFQTVRTRGELEAWYVDAQREDYLRQQADRAAEELKAQALKKSVINVDEDERRGARAAGERILREQWIRNGLPLEEMTDEQAAELTGFSSAQEFIDWFAGLSEAEVSAAALGYELLLAEGREPTEERWREALRRMKEEEGIAEKELSEYTLPVYARQISAEHYHDTLAEYAYQIIKENLS